MLLYQLSINIFLFFIGLIGVTFNYNSIITCLIGIELMLLSSNLNFIFFSLYLNDLYGLVFSLFILTIAASESAVGLAILILSYKIRNSLEITENSAKS